MNTSQYRSGFLGGGGGRSEFLNFLYAAPCGEWDIAPCHADVAQLAFRKPVQLDAGFAVFPPAGVGLDQFHWRPSFVPLLSGSPPWRSDVLNIGAFNRFVQCNIIMEAIPKLHD
jgi:hypothetical protein